MQEVANLLSSQKSHREKVEKLYRKVGEKNKEHENFDVLERSCEGILEFADELITNNTKLLEAFMKNGSASDGE